ncbi:MAG: aminoacetone oxidase family FAD-binding enzyme [Clostridia bacterium]|nr:aminoacetone oxidase family FAD-binding enzyme [Clostridia bacterium]
MKTFQTIIIGGGAAGLTIAAMLAKTQKNILVLERNDRVGKKLSSTGNGQGNVTNLGVLHAEYFSVAKNSDGRRIENILRTYDDTALRADLKKLGVITLADEKGRVYPAGRQASSLTDALRFYVQEQGVTVGVGARVTSMEREKNGLLITAETSEGREEYRAENAVLCTGGKAAKNFGTDGSAYALATALGHSVTPLYPSLVQLKTDTKWTKTLKGIRINDGVVTLLQGNKTLAQEKGDIIFTDYGVSGDAIFRISAFVGAKIDKEDLRLRIDLLPEVAEEELRAMLGKKRATFTQLPLNELLGGMLNNQVGRAVLKRADNDLEKAARIAKGFEMDVTGSLGFDYAQVTKGGIPLSETDENLQSIYVDGLYFAGEILDVDGQCGGYNLQWAYASAKTVANAILMKGRGQV